jgi:CRP-like cAMP-binding protein
MESKFDILFDTLDKKYHFTDFDQNFVMKIFKFKKITKGEYFIKAGEIPDKIAFVIKGIFRYFYIDFNGKDSTKYFCVENSFLSSYSAMIQKKGSNYFIEALEDSEILVSNFKDITENPHFQIFSRNLLNKAIIYKEKRENDFLQKNGSQRYVDFITDYPLLEERIPHYYIASYLGLTPVSLSRIRKKLSLT